MCGTINYLTFVAYLRDRCLSYKLTQNFALPDEMTLDLSGDHLFQKIVLTIDFCDKNVFVHTLRCTCIPTTYGKILFC